MKIYFIDKYEKYLNVKNKLENVELKKDLNFRIYKTDYVITFDFEDEYEEYRKVNNLIIVTNKKNKNDIWKMANRLNTKDIILNQNDDYYIAERIKKTINI